MSGKVETDTACLGSACAVSQGFAVITDVSGLGVGYVAGKFEYVLKISENMNPYFKFEKLM